MPYRAKGYGLLDTVVVLMGLCVLTLLALPYRPLRSYEANAFLNRYLRVKAQALTTYNDTTMNNSRGLPIHFTAKGNINHGQSIRFDDKTLIFHLGNGSFREEK